jgi:hypothetical protein
MVGIDVRMMILMLTWASNVVEVGIKEVWLSNKFMGGTHDL